MQQAPFNPTITLTMSLNTFHAAQAILAKRPFEEVVDMIMDFRGQVIPQVQEAQREIDAAAQREPPSAPPSPVTRLHLAEDGKAG